MRRLPVAAAAVVAAVLAAACQLLTGIEDHHYVVRAANDSGEADATFADAPPPEASLPDAQPYVCFTWPGPPEAGADAALGVDAGADAIVLALLSFDNGNPLVGYDLDCRPEPRGGCRGHAGATSLPAAPADNVTSLLLSSGPRTVEVRRRSGRAA